MQKKKGGRMLFFMKVEEMSRVGSRDRHAWWRSKSHKEEQSYSVSILDFFVLVVCHQDMPYKVTSVRWDETFFVDHSCSLTSILYYLWCHNKWSYVNWHLGQLIWFYLIPNPGHHGPELNIKNITSFWVIFRELSIVCDLWLKAESWSLNFKIQQFEF